MPSPPKRLNGSLWGVFRIRSIIYDRNKRRLFFLEISTESFAQPKVFNVHSRTTVPGVDSARPD